MPALRALSSALSLSGSAPDTPLPAYYVMHFAPQLPAQAVGITIERYYKDVGINVGKSSLIKQWD